MEQTGYLTGAGGVRLFYRTWLPPEPGGSMVLVHGMNEHSGRYGHVAGHFAARGWAVYAVDHRGFGQSEGTRCYADRFEQYVEDLRAITAMAAQHGQPVMVGHSFGGLLAFHYAATHPDTIAGLVLSAAGFRPLIRPRPHEQALLPLLSRLAPRLQFGTLHTLRPELLSRDPAVVQAYYDDPLVLFRASARFAAEAQAAARRSWQGRAARLAMPVLFLHGEADRLTDPVGSREMYPQVPHARKALRLYPGMYHEIFNEHGHEQVLGDITDWLRQEGLAPAAAPA